MNIGPRQQSIVGMIVAFATVRTNVGGFDHCENGAGNSTFVACDFSSCEARSRGAGMSEWKPLGLVAGDFFVRSG